MTQRSTAKREKKAAAKTATRSKRTQALTVVDLTKALPRKVVKPGEVVVSIPTPNCDAFVLENLKREIASHNRPAPKFASGVRDGSADLAFVRDSSVEQMQWVAGINAVGGAGTQSSLLVANMIAKYAEKTYGGVSQSLAQLNQMLAQAVELAPRDAIEGMLVSQMVTTYHESMRMLSKAAQATQITHGEYNHNQSARLMRLFTLQLDALNKHRGRGPSEQKVTVQHVHVHEGGQAVVGNVKHGGTAGAGGASESDG